MPRTQLIGTTPAGIDVLLERLEALEERLNAATAEHARLHEAHDARHLESKEHLERDLMRAEQWARETAETHATAHAREHELATEATAKAEESNTVRFEHLNEAKARSQDERATFATRTQLDDKIAAAEARLDTVERHIATNVDRMAQIGASAAAIDKLEKAGVATIGRDRGISMSWGILIAVLTVVVAVVSIFLARGG